jgi:uncharacterized protein (TIGR03435 family)
MTFGNPLEVVASFGPSILAKATLILVLTLAAVRLSGHGRASVRHILLTAAFAVLFVLPFAAVLAPPVSVDVAPVSLALEEYVGQVAFIDSLPPMSAGDVTSTDAPPLRQTLTPLQYAAAVWMVGVILCALPVLVGLVQIRRWRRRGLPWLAGQRLIDSLTREIGLGRRVDVLLHESISTPATCGVSGHMMLFPIDAATWPDDDVRRAAIHELEHVRRGDYFVTVFTRLICALYWCHPLAWATWRRLGLEAERACDDAVLDRAEATAYADQLVALASRVSENTRHPLLAMANRSDLVRRVTAVLDQRQARGHVGFVLAAAIVSAAGVLTAAISPLEAINARTAAGARAPQMLDDAPQLDGVRAEAGVPLAVSGGARTNVPVAGPRVALTPALSAQTAAGSSRPAFDVASIRRNAAGGVPTMRVEAGRFVAQNISLLELVLDAYRIQSFQVVGGPEWRQSSAPGPTRAAPASQRPGDVTFDVIANIPQNTPPAQVPLMKQTLLADRFNLVVHTDMRSMPVYVLTHARDDKRLGPQLTTSTQQCQAEIEGGPLRAPVTRVSEDGKPVCSMMMSPRLIRGGGLTMRFLAHALTVYVRRTVVDRTGLAGPFDFHLTYAPAARGGGPAPSDDQPSIFTAVQEQLGLTLEPATAPVEVLVIDSVSMPTEN